MYVGKVAACCFETTTDAVKAGDPLLAVIRGSAVNHNGLSNGITAPNGAAQEEVIHRALCSADVEPGDISHLEVMGTATALGDPIEVSALRAVYLPQRAPSQTCWIGSVKPNIRHLEAASGAASIIKVILSLQHRQIPPHLHCEEPTAPPIERDRLSDTACGRAVGAGIRPATHRRQCVGFGGANAHMILEEAPEVPSEDERAAILLHVVGENRARSTRPHGRYLNSSESHRYLISGTCVLRRIRAGRYSTIAQPSSLICQHLYGQLETFQLHVPKRLCSKPRAHL